MFYRTMSASDPGDAQKPKSTPTEWALPSQDGMLTEKTAPPPSKLLANPLADLSRALAPGSKQALTQSAVAAPTHQEKEGEIGSSLQHVPMRVIASVAEDGLGLPSWWSGDAEEEVEEEKS